MAGRIARRLIGAAGLAALAGTAQAQLAPAEAWAALESAWGAMGLEVAASRAPDGRALAVSALQVTGTLPFGLGTLSAEGPELRLSPRGDGAVAVAVPDPARIVLTLSLSDRAGPAVLRLPLRATWEGGPVLATGRAGDVTFAWDSGPFAVSLDGARLDGPQAGEAALFALDARLDRYSGTARVRTGERVVLDADLAFGAAIWGTSGLDPRTGDETRQIGRADPSSATLALSLPPGGLSPEALARDLRAGLVIDLATAAGPSLTQNATFEGGTLTDLTETDSAAGTGRLRLDAAGLLAEARIEGIALRSQQSRLGLTLGGTLGEYGFGLRFPLLAGPEPQPFALRLALRDAAPDERTWGIIDPAGLVPRDPATLAFDIGGTLRLPFDATDPAGWARFASDPEGWLGLETLHLTGLELRAAGAALAGEGEAALDPSAAPALDGLPGATARAAFEARGLQSLLDRLAAQGAIPPEQARGLRLALALLFDATGPDSGRSELELRRDGALIVNGQRLR
jgi:hypothetical protein